jgi:hypothetical protein
MMQNCPMKKEFVFQIEQDEDMLVAICHEPEMATQGENPEELPGLIRDLIRCRFDEGDACLGRPIRLHFIHDPVLSAPVRESPAGSLRGRGLPRVSTLGFQVRSANRLAPALRKRFIPRLCADAPEHQAKNTAIHPQAGWSVC